MGYVETNLVQGEEVQYRAKLHWAMYVPYALIALATAGLALPLVLIPIIRRLTTELAVTNLRVIIKTGLISRRTMEMQRTRIETVSVDQGIFGRMLGYGTVAFTGTGGSRERFTAIDRPLDFKRAATEPGVGERVAER